MRGAWARLARERRCVRRIDPSFMGLDFESLTLRGADGLELAAWYLPHPRRVRASTALAIVHHHFGGQRATTLPWLPLLQAAGLSTIVFDGRGHGASQAPASAHQEQFVERVHDVQAALAWGQARGYRRVVGVGQSQGAAVTLMALARHAGTVAFVLDSGPSPDMGTASWGLAGHLIGDDDGAPEQRIARLAVAFDLWSQSEPIAYSTQLSRALADARRTPLLWIHGDSDTIIPRERARLWYRAYGVAAPWSELAVARANHCQPASRDPDGVARALSDLLGARG